MTSVAFPWQHTLTEMASRDAANEERIVGVIKSNEDFKNKGQIKHN